MTPVDRVQVMFLHLQTMMVWAVGQLGRFVAWAGSGSQAAAVAAG